MTRQIIALLFMIGFMEALFSQTSEPLGDPASDSDDLIHQIPHDLDRSPYDLAISPSEMYAATANQISNSVSLIRLSDHKLVDEISCGSQPTDLEFLDDHHLLLTAKWQGELQQFKIR